MLVSLCGQTTSFGLFGRGFGVIDPFDIEKGDYFDDLRL